MRRLFQVKPENDLERLGCEGCHGPGSNHAITGGGVGIGGLIEFRIDRGQSIERANQACMNCHDEAFWHGRRHGMRRLACFDCHLVMTRMRATRAALRRALEQSTHLGFRDAYRTAHGTLPRDGFSNAAAQATR